MLIRLRLFKEGKVEELSFIILEIVLGKVLVLLLTTIENKLLLKQFFQNKKSAQIGRFFFPFFKDLLEKGPRYSWNFILKKLISKIKNTPSSLAVMKLGEGLWPAPVVGANCNLFSSPLARECEVTGNRKDIRTFS